MSVTQNQSELGAQSYYWLQQQQQQQQLM